MFSLFHIKRIYRTKFDEIDKDFLIPLLSHSKEYYRGTGYFSVNALANISTGLIPYIKNGGIVRIITSVELGIEERTILQKGLELGENVVIDILNQQIDNELDVCDGIIKMDLITNLIASNRIIVKIAYMPFGGIYHEKIGFLTDEFDNSILFVGSSNETYNAYKKNLESFVVFKSWDGDVEEINEQKKYFELLWENEYDEIKVFEFPEATKRKLFEKYKSSQTIEESLEKYEGNLLSNTCKSKKIELYPYQTQAINDFVNNEFNHFFEMATGTGKTITAIYAIKRLNLDIKDLLVVIIVPQIDLQDQWKKVMSEMEMKIYLFGGNSKTNNWETDFDECIINYYNEGGLHLIISIYDTYFTKLNKVLDNLNINKMIVVDEAHELSLNQMSKLSKDFKFRLGLSATPERHDYDETINIINYFTLNRVDTFKYSIDEAIENGFLSKYNYYPIFVNLNERDFENYQNYTKRLIFLYNQKKRDYDQISEVSNNRSMILKKTNSKLDKFKDMVINQKFNFSNSVIYCGMGKDKESEESIIDIVTKILSNDGKYRVSQFTSKTEYRNIVLAEFENGYYDTLVAMKCFDQGVDVPKLDKIYIMSSDSILRQTIQRRGRVLRQCKETGKDMAFIYDMVVLPPQEVINGIGVKSLVSNELKRVKEYMRLGVNFDLNKDLIENIEQIYNITKEDFINEELY